MSDALSDLLATRDWLLCDGAMGTSLFQRGLETGEAPDLRCISQPKKSPMCIRAFV